MQFAEEHEEQQVEAMEAEGEVSIFVVFVHIFLPYFTSCVF
jgi:hypothetical protein